MVKGIKGYLFFSIGENVVAFVVLTLLDLAFQESHYSLSDPTSFVCIKISKFRKGFGRKKTKGVEVVVRMSVAKNLKTSEGGNLERTSAGKKW